MAASLSTAGPGRTFRASASCSSPWPGAETEGAAVPPRSPCGASLAPRQAAAVAASTRSSGRTGTRASRFFTLVMTGAPQISYKESRRAGSASAGQRRARTRRRMSPGKTTLVVQAVAQAARRRRSWLALARRRGLTTAEAEDALQRALLRAVAGASSVRDVRRAPAWVARIVRNEFVEALRAARPVLEPVESVAAPSSEDPPCHCVLAQLTRLPEGSRSLLQWTAVEGTSLGEVAERLGVSPNAAGVRVWRARAELRRRMAEHCGTTTARSCTECGCAERGCCAEPAAGALGTGGCGVRSPWRAGPRERTGPPRPTSTPKVARATGRSGSEARTDHSPRRSCRVEGRTAPPEWSFAPRRTPHRPSMVALHAEAKSSPPLGRTSLHRDGRPPTGGSSLASPRRSISHGRIGLHVAAWVRLPPVGRTAPRPEGRPPTGGQGFASPQRSVSDRWVELPFAATVGLPAVDQASHRRERPVPALPTERFHARAPP